MLTRRSLSFLLMASPLVACRTPAGPADDVAIRDATMRMTEAWNRHDAKAWVAPFADDADFVNILGMLLQGRGEIERRHAELFAGIFAKSSVVVTTRRLQMLGRDGAVAETDYELRGYDRLPPGIRATDSDGTLRTRLNYVWTRRGDGWRIVSAQNTAVLPPAGGRP